MRRPLILLALVVLPARLIAQALAFQHVNVIDVRAGLVLPDQTVVVDQGRISNLGPGSAIKAPAGAKLIDAHNQYLIPGLWDMHVHSAWPNLAPTFAELYVANGVTGVREMFGDLAVLRDWKARSAAGEPWPRIVGSGHILDGPHPFWPRSVVAGNAEEARHAVDSLHAAGADFIKVYSKLPHDAFIAALEEAKHVGTYAVGHVPLSSTVAEASDKGMRSIEHLTGIAKDCSREGAAIRAAGVARMNDTSIVAPVSPQAQRILATPDSATCAALIARLARNQTWQTPTLTVQRSTANLDNAQFTNDTRTRYMPAALIDSWRSRNGPLRARAPDAFANRRRQFQRDLELVRAMHTAGVPILAGTDVLNPYVFPGFSLHDELALLVDAGLSAADALRAATLNPAIFLNMTDSLGTVEQGKRADLVLLDANPLADIHNTQKIRAVVLNGRLYERAALDEMLARAERNTASRK